MTKLSSIIGVIKTDKKMYVMPYFDYLLKEKENVACTYLLCVLYRK